MILPCLGWVRSKVFDLCVVKTHETQDGSKTLFSAELNVHYHSVHGAWNETRHVFGAMGVDAAMARASEGDLHVLEIGFGTGLNALDVWLRAKKAQRRVVMVSLEPNPLQWDDVACLGYSELTGVPVEVWQGMHEEGRWEDEFLSFQRIPKGLFEFELDEQRFDVILFDAFAPAAQPELWTSEAMDRMRMVLTPGGQLVTYCAKGEVRRAMKAAGFQVERLPGPPGKREMMRATRPCNPLGKFNVRVYMLVVRTLSSGHRQVLVSYERLPMGAVMKFPGGGLEWGECVAACVRREALEELRQPIEVGPLVHVSQQTHVSSFDANHQIIAVHHEAQLLGPVTFDDDGELEDVRGKRVPMMHQRLGWRDIESLAADEFHFASDREAWKAWRDRKGK